MKLSYIYYKIVRGALRLNFPHAKTVYEEQPDSDPAIFVSNHSAVIGPVMMTLDFKRKHQTWAVGNALDSKKAANFAFHDIFFGNSRRCKWFWRMLSRIVAKGLPPLLYYSDTIPVYHDKNILKTFKQSVKALTEGDDLVIFAESPKRYSEFVCELQPGFIDVARLYYRKSGKAIKFYPVYLEKKNAVISVGKPVAYDPEQPLDEQRGMIAEYLRDNIDRLARTLPEHKPVPFLPERWYSAYGMYEDDVYGYWKMIDDTGSDKSE